MRVLLQGGDVDWGVPGAGDDHDCGFRLGSVTVAMFHRLYLGLEIKCSTFERR